MTSNSFLMLHLLFLNLNKLILNEYRLLEFGFNLIALFIASKAFSFLPKFRVNQT